MKGCKTFFCLLIISLFLGMGPAAVSADPAQGTENTGNGGPVIIQEPLDQEAATDETVTFTAVAEKAASYQWQYSKNGGEAWYDILSSDASSASYSMKAERPKCSPYYLLRCRITGTNGETVDTQAVSILRKPELLITGEPEDQPAQIGLSVRFSVEAVNAASYQWECSRDGEKWLKIKKPVSNKSEFAFKASEKSLGYSYRCRIRGTDGSEKFTKVVHADKGVCLTNQTTGPVYVKEGERTILSVTAENAAFFQWSVLEPSQSAWKTCTETTAQSGQLELLFEKGKQDFLYRCEITGIDGSKVCSKSVSLRGQSSDLINVKEFGAVGDGLTDDTEALQQAFAAARGKSLFIPAGTYLFSESLSIHDQSHIYGQGAVSVLKAAPSIVPVRIPWRNTEKECLILFDEEASSCRLENFTLEGQKDHQVDFGQYGICVRGTGHTIENMIIHDINYFPEKWVGGLLGYDSVNAPAYGLVVYNARNVTVKGGHFYNCAYECVGVENSSQVTFDGLECGPAFKIPLQIHRNSDGITVKNCILSEENSPIVSDSGLSLHGVADALVQNVTISDCQIDGHIYGVQGGECNITIENCTVEGSIFNSKDYSSDHDWTVRNCTVKSGINLQGTNMIIE